MSTYFNTTKILRAIFSTKSKSLADVFAEIDQKYFEFYKFISRDNEQQLKAAASRTFEY